MLIRKECDIKSSEITPKELYMNRRQFIAGAAALAVAGSVAPDILFLPESDAGQKLPVVKRGEFTVQDKQTSFEAAAHYNNFYEFSTNKEDVAEPAARFRTRPWTVTVEGHIKKPKTYDIDALIKIFPLEERVYRFRCVEGWSMVLPWVGFPLSDLIKLCDPTSKARFVKFTTLYDPEQMPGQRRDVLKWPYLEGLRIDEAMHPLTMLAVGMYGEIMPNQNGAPIRLVVPWKYGFKSIKSIVRIGFVEEMPITTWMQAGPKEYGFYANVNPDVSHPRWSQATERRLGEFFRQKTMMFNGYADQVANLYTGMDLKKFFRMTVYSMESDMRSNNLIKPVVFIISLAPLLLLIAQAFTGGLGANPVEKALHTTGDWALIFLLITLAVTPIRHLTGVAWLVGLRRMTGLFGFFYALLHFIIYTAVDQFFSFDAIIEDIEKHNRIIVGFVSFLLLVLLAVTSTNTMIRRLGADRWLALHRLTYIAAAGGVIHYLLLVKKDIRSPLIYTGILILLFGYRIAIRLLRR